MELVIIIIPANWYRYGTAKFTLFRRNRLDCTLAGLQRHRHELAAQLQHCDRRAVLDLSAPDYRGRTVFVPNLVGPT